MNSKDGLILWTLGAAGTLLIYSAVKNLSPAETLKGYFTNTPPTPAAAVSRSYDIKGPGYTTQLDTNGLDTRNAPIAYANYPRNRVPLRGIKIY